MERIPEADSGVRFQKGVKFSPPAFWLSLLLTLALATGQVFYATAVVAAPLNAGSVIAEDDDDDQDDDDQDDDDHDGDDHDGDDHDGDDHDGDDHDGDDHDGDDQNGDDQNGDDQNGDDQNGDDNDEEKPESDKPSLCESGQLVARPDVVGVQPSQMSVMIYVLQNDGAVPPHNKDELPPHHDPEKPEKPEHPKKPVAPNSSDAASAGVLDDDNGNDDGDGDDDKDDDHHKSQLTIVDVGAPKYGQATIVNEGQAIEYTVQASEVEAQEEGIYNYVDMFTYSIVDSCNRTAESKVMVIVFDDEMPSTPALLKRPVQPGTKINQTLSLPYSATITIPGGNNGDGKEDEADDEEADAEADVDVFSVTDLGTPQKAIDKAPGAGLKFANVAFRIVNFRNGARVVDPVFSEPLVLELLFGAKEIDELDDAEGEPEPKLFYWHEGNQRWQQDGITRLSYDKQTGKVTFAIYHLTEFALFAGPAQSALPQIYIPAAMNN